MKNWNLLSKNRFLQNTIMWSTNVTHFYLTQLKAIDSLRKYIRNQHFTVHETLLTQYKQPRN